MSDKLGTVFNPQKVGEGYRVQFMYAPECYYEVILMDDGALRVRTSGSHGDLLATEHHVANDLMVRARRWSNSLNRYAEFHPKEGA